MTLLVISGVAGEGKEENNTAAFDVWNSTNIAISNSLKYNQADCLALHCGKKYLIVPRANIIVSNLYCHGSHDLSISVGFSVSNVSFYNLTIDSGRNGIHIKTHVEGGYDNITEISHTMAY